MSEQQDARGRFLPGNTARLKDGRRSQQLADGLLLPPGAPLPYEREAAVLADLGDTSNVQRGLVRRLVHLELIAEWLEGNLLAQGVLTTKGKSRAAVATYLATTDRIVRLSTTLGLDRRPRNVGTIEAVHDAVKRVNA
jgi:hypothetical protein